MKADDTAEKDEMLKTLGENPWQNPAGGLIGQIVAYRDSKDRCPEEISNRGMRLSQSFMKKQ